MDREIDACRREAADLCVRRKRRQHHNLFQSRSRRRTLASSFNPHRQACRRVFARDAVQILAHERGHPCHSLCSAAAARGAESISERENQDGESLMESLVTANIRSRPTRTFISVLAVALGVILMLIVGGICSGTLNDYLERTRMVGADFILQPSGSSVFYAFSGASLPINYVDKLTEVRGVNGVLPVL